MRVGRRTRIVLTESERDIAKLLEQAASAYERSDMAFELHKMHFLHEDMREEGKSLVVCLLHAKRHIEWKVRTVPFHSQLLGMQNHFLTHAFRPPFLEVIKGNGAVGF